ncbi:MAG: putative integral membrane protein (TIGR00697 family) [Myxococcota bacterium]|jgi:uncharacterized integral membrane protein (TIGR00697 family)
MANDTESGERGMPRSEIGFLVLAGIFIVSLVVANMVAAKLFVFSGIVLVVGLIPYPVTFLATDLMCEVYGQKRANTVVFLGFALSLYVLLILKLGEAAPPFEAVNVQHEYEVIFGNSARAIFASMVAYLVAQLIDVRLFHFWKRVTNGRHLWLRNNGSTVLSQMVDSILVVSILFADKMSFEQLVQTIVAGYVFKLIAALVDTPLFYYGARWFRVLIGQGDDVVPKQRRTQRLIIDTALAVATIGAAIALVGVASTWVGATDGHAAIYGWGTTGGLVALVAGFAAIVVGSYGLSEFHRVARASIVLMILGILMASLGVAGQQTATGMGPDIVVIGAVVCVGSAVVALAGWKR